MRHHEIIYSFVVPVRSTLACDRSQELNRLLRTIPDLASIEVVVVDDHSEIPLSIDHQFNSARLICCVNDDGKRFAGTARNAGIKKSSGRYIIFADSDDLFIPDGLVNVLTHAAYSTADVIFFRSESFGDGPPRHINLHNVLERAGSHSDPTSVLAWYCSPISFLVRRSYLEKERVWFPALRTSEDRVFLARLSANRPSCEIMSDTAYRISSEVHQSLAPSTEVFRDIVVATRLANDALIEAQRPEVALSVLKPILTHFWNHPFVSLHLLVESLVRGDVMLPRRFRRSGSHSTTATSKRNRGISQ